MSVAEQRSVIQRWIAAWNAKDLDAAVELLAEGYVRHDANLPEVVGPRAQRDFLAGLFMAFQISTFNLNGSLLKRISLSCTLLCKAQIEASSWVCRLPDGRS